MCDYQAWWLLMSDTQRQFCQKFVRDFWVRPKFERNSIKLCLKFMFEVDICVDKTRVSYTVDACQSTM